MIQNTIISLIAAIGKNRELGDSGKIPWHISEDFKRFKQLTLGHPIIMGRKTWESLPVKPLPGRYNIVITRDTEYGINGLKEGENFVIVDSLDEAVKKSIKYYVSSSMYKEKIHNTKYMIPDTEHEVFIIGGGQIFEQSISLADKLYLTIIESDFKADTFFPDYSNFKKVVFEKMGESGRYKYKFVELEN